MKLRPTKTGFWIIAVILIVIAALWVFRSTTTVAQLSAINRQITQESRFSWGTSTDLKNQSLKNVSSSDTAYFMIKAAGYSQLKKSQIPAALLREFQEGVRFFHREVNGFPCGLDYYVILHSSIEDDIESAIGVRREKECP